MPEVTGIDLKKKMMIREGPSLASSKIVTFAASSPTPEELETDWECYMS